MAHRLTPEALVRKLDELAEYVDDLASRYRDDSRPLEGEDWVTLDGVADELAALAKDARSDLLLA